MHNCRGKTPNCCTVRGQWNKACASAGIGDASLRAMAEKTAKSLERGKSRYAMPYFNRMTAHFLRGMEIQIADGPDFRQALDAR